ncbi:MAG: hypothetical protein SPF89_08915 [Sphaerochaetaceae bacterium]|nr:hypothetical protein [Spirochaetales bacterium]MDY5500212.1 hypothetical protein [Sphaerochaetaceae bacterium]
MTYKKIRIVFTTPFSSLPTADQLFGQIVWAISDLYGEHEADEFMEKFSQNPPFLISATIPEGFMPVPFYPPMKQVVADGKSRAKAKQNKKRKWIPLNEFCVLQRDQNQIRTFDFSSGPKIGEKVEEHVRIDRNTLRADDGSLHAERYVTTANPLVAYISFRDDQVRQMTALLHKVCEYFGIVGLGGNRNVGRGVCTVSLVDLNEEEEQIFKFHSTAPQPFMTLSRCSGEDLLQGAVAYSVTAYTGITGRADNGLFNKKPVVGFELGATFRNGKGNLVRDVHPNGKVCTYAYAFPVPISLEE